MSKANEAAPQVTFCIPIPGPLQEARFVARPNRFLLEARMEGGEAVTAHLPDPGRLRELLLPDCRLWLRPASNPGRRTRWSAVLVEAPDGAGPVSLDTTLANRLVRAALEGEGLPELRPWTLERAEAVHGRSRFDFSLRNESDERLWLEVKSVTLVEDRVGRFPDAVSARAARHLRELAAIAIAGQDHAAVLFVAQRGDARRVEPAAHIDPDFGVAWTEARQAGVRFLARRCTLDLERICLAEQLPVG